MAIGTCNCGAIGFEISGELSDVYVCHCSICRRSSGSNGIAVVVISNDRFQWTHGEELIASWQKPDADWQTWFCRICGSRVPGTNDASRMFVPAAAITHGAKSLEVKHHIWVDSKAGWDEIGDCGRQHKEAFKAEE